MKTRNVLSLFVCLALALHATAASSQYAPRPGGSGVQSHAQQGLGLAVVTHLSGESLLMSADDEEWGALPPQLPLRNGDRVWAQDDARFEIRFPLGATAWVNYQSELDITLLERGSRSDSIQLALVSGEASFDVKGFARPGSVFQVDLPGVSIRASRAARFRVNTLPDGTAQIGVISGSLVLETPDGLTDVAGGHMAELLPDQRLLLDFLPDGDEWDGWVQSRAAIYDKPAASRRYLPADLTPYAHEFDGGRWVTDRAHGTVWVPAVEEGWSPYSNGRWVWQADDYVWLSYDPWYAPFHYGRWNWNVTVGWFWIVPRGKAYWSPGYVGWSVEGDEVSWVPLGHNEVYYGYGNYGPESVNVFNKTVFNVTNVYVNSKVKNGVVAVGKENFLRGKIVRERLAPERNPFEARGKTGLKILAKPPVHEFKPLRETRQPRPEVEVKRLALPPVRLENASKSIRKRVVAPTREKSVFKPGNKPAPLKNIQKAQELEQYVAPRKGKAPRATVAPPAPERPARTVAPGKKAPQAVQEPAAQAPAGKRQFKRVREPQGGAGVAPPPVVAPRERRKGDKDGPSPEEEEERERGRGAGRNK